MSQAMNEELESLNYDVLIVGAGPAGLACACKLKQLALQQGRELSVCVLEKSGEVGGHIVSGAVMEPRALSELFPDWRELGAPLDVAVKEDKFYYFASEKIAIKFPHFLVPKTSANDGNYIISLGNLCRWLARQAEDLGVEIYPGFAAAELLCDSSDKLIGVQTQAMGLDHKGEKKSTYQAPMQILAPITVLAEGCRGHLGKQLIEKYHLDRDSGPQHYALGIKEVWRIPKELHRPGEVVHAFGWPLVQHGATGRRLFIPRQQRRN